jgi:hypothetical protein
LLSLPTGDLHIIKRGTRRVVPTFIRVQKIVVLQQFLHSSLKKISSLSFSHTAFTLLSVPPSSAPHQEPARFPWQDRRRSIRRTTMWPRALALPPQPWTRVVAVLFLLLMVDGVAAALFLLYSPCPPPPITVPVV